MSERPIRCLVADDHPALVEAVSAFLTNEGYEIVGQARDGLTAVESVRETLPDVALVDYRMPRLEGARLLEQLREAAPEMLIAVYTADADQSIVGIVFEAGAHALILKDAPLTDLGQALEAICSGRRYVDPALASARAHRDREEACAHPARGRGARARGRRPLARRDRPPALDQPGNRADACAQGLRAPERANPHARRRYRASTRAFPLVRPERHGARSLGFAVLASLDGKTAIVTGASSGIGAATAHALAEAGARVAVGARRVESLPDREGFYASTWT